MSDSNKDMDEVRTSFSNFQARNKLREPADNMKMIVVGILVLSLFIFTAIGEENVKPIILYWAGFMSLLLIGCAIQDIIIVRKIKKL